MGFSPVNKEQCRERGWRSWGDEREKEELAGEDAKNEGSETETVNPVQYVLNTLKKKSFLFCSVPRLKKQNKTLVPLINLVWKCHCLHDMYAQSVLEPPDTIVSNWSHFRCDVNNDPAVLFGFLCRLLTKSTTALKKEGGEILGHDQRTHCISR